MSAGLLLLLLASVYSAHASIFCPHPVYPSTNEEFVTSSIQTREQKPSKEAYYRIAEDGEDPAFKRQSARFRLMTTRDSTECPFRGCLSELAPSEPKNHATSLYQTSVIGKMIPPGFFAMDVPQRLYCVVTDGDCGATIPLYRHYRWTPTGIYHAYTIEADAAIEGYTKELTPLCYVWPVKRPEIASSEAPSTLLPSLNDILQRLAARATTPTPVPSTTSAAAPKKTKAPKDSTEEEIRQENLNIVKETKPSEISEEVEGSGAEEPKEKKAPKKAEQKAEKKVARDQPKKKAAKDEPKKLKKEVEIVEKKTEIKTKAKKKDEKKPEPPKTTAAPIDASTSAEDSDSQEEVSAEQLIGADRVLHFESADEPKQVNKTVITGRVIAKADDEMPKPAALMADGESVLKSDEDEERAKELAKFNGRKSGKEPLEIEEQNDERPAMLRFEDAAN